VFVWVFTCCSFCYFRFHLPSRLANAVNASEARFAGGGLRWGNHAFLLMLAEYVSLGATDERSVELLAAEPGWQQLVSKRKLWGERKGLCLNEGAKVDGPLHEATRYESSLPADDSDSERDSEKGRDDEGMGALELGGLSEQHQVRTNGWMRLLVFRWKKNKQTNKQYKLRLILEAGKTRRTRRRRRTRRETSDRTKRRARRLERRRTTTRWTRRHEQRWKSCAR
jgi:hypothetical protein